MPVYTYRCEECGIQFEKTQKFTDAPLKRCPECGKSSLQKVYSPVGIIFKGSGFYATDHRSASGATRHSDHSDSKTNKTDSAGKGSEDKSNGSESKAASAESATAKKTD